MQALSNGSRALDCMVASSEKIMEVSSARDAPANMADIPTSAQSGMLNPHCGKKLRIKYPDKAPVAPPIVSSGARVPPEVPLPSAIAQEMNFSTQRYRIT